MAGSLQGLRSQLEAACSSAVESVCGDLVAKLSSLVQSEFYAQYSPKIYQRTGQLGASPDTRMLSKARGEVFMNEEGMSYNYTTGGAVISDAASGVHGTPAITTPGRYWESFIAYCDQNVEQMLRAHISSGI